MAVSTAINQSDVARALGIKTIFETRSGTNVIFLPQGVAVVGQGSTASTYSLTKTQYSNAVAVGTAYGFGSPLHLAALQLFPTNGDGLGSVRATFYPLVDDVSGVASVEMVTATGTATAQATYFVTVNNQRSAAIVLSAGDGNTEFIAAAITAVASIINMPVIASDGTTTLDLESKWAGQSANQIVVQIEGPVDNGITFAVAQATPGAVNPDIQTALDQVGDVWETMFLNCFDTSDTTALDAFSDFGEGRWGSLVHKPMVAFVGDNSIPVATATAVTDARKTDRTNIQLVAPGSNDFLFEIAARQLARIAVLANNNPPHDYGSQAATGLTPGADGGQWDFPQRDEAVKKGSSTIEVRDGVINVSDVVTMFHPTGDPLPAYRFLVDNVKVWNIIFNVDLIFNRQEWDGAPLIADFQPTVNPSAKKPKMAKAELSAMIDQLGLQAIISDPDTAKANTIVQINDQNPKRLDMCVPVEVSGNTNQKAVDIKWSFFVGTSTIIA